MLLLNKKKESSYLDLYILILTLIIAAIGCFLLYTVSQGKQWMLKQLYTICFFFVITLLVRRINIALLYKYTNIVYASCIILLVITSISGHAAMGAQRWIHLYGINIQPSELTKIAIIMQLSQYFHKNYSTKIHNIKSLLAVALIILVPVILILKQPNLGTATSIIIMSGMILFGAGIRKSVFIYCIISALVLLPFIWNGMHDYQKRRMLSFLYPENDLLGSGYNVIQSQIAIGSGGIYGKGFMEGTQHKLNFLPEKHTDFIFTVLAEEFGFIGVTIVIILYLSLIMLCYFVAACSQNHYGRIIAFGVGSMIYVNMIINISMISGLMPVVGIPLPLLSYGGSNISSTLIAIGLVANVSKNRNVHINK